MVWGTPPFYAKEKLDAIVLAPLCGSNIFPCDDEVIEVNDVGRVFGPAVCNVRLQRERVGFERLGFAPIDVRPVTEQTAINPEGLLTVRLPWRVVLEHELGADPAVLLDDRLRSGQERVAPVLAVGRHVHLVPIAVEIPLTWRGPSRPVAPGFKRGGKAFVAGGTLTRAAEATPFVAAMQAFVGAEGDEMVDVIAAWVEANIKADEDSLGGLEPFGKTAAMVLPKARLDSEAASSADLVHGRREAESFIFGRALLIPARS